MNTFQEQTYTNRFDIGLWRKLLRYAKPYKKSLITLGMFMIGIGTIDALFPLMNKYAIDHYVVPKSLEGIAWFTALYVLMICLQTIIIRLMVDTAGKIETGICYDIRKDGFQRLQELSFSYYDQTPIGWLMSRMTSDIRKLGNTLSWGLVDCVWGATMMLAITTIVLYLDWKLALIILSVVPFLAIVSVLFQKKILHTFRHVRKTNSLITGAFNEGLSGAKATKVLVREEKNLQEFQVLTGQMQSSSVKAATISSLYMPIVLILGSIGTGLALWLGGEGVLAGTIKYGTLVAFTSYTVQFFEPIRDLARIFTELQSAQASAERIFTMIETEPEITDSQQIIAKYGDVFHPRKKTWPEMKGNITFENVSFAYKDGEKVLEGFNLNVSRGETIALVGETGSGKSTIVNLACRFYEPTEGQILIDGIDYRKRSLLWLHANLGYVLQTPHLFSGTIKENIRYGRLEAGDEEMITAAKLVNAHEFIEKLENGYDTEVGEGGGKLSTGEKQLISFARAILANPRIFILDEATSSVDTETEQIIQHAIHKVLEGRTSFIIAHRLSTIRAADRILVIRQGKVIEEGNHHELLKQRGYYYRLYTNQFMKEEEKKLGVTAYGL